MKTIRIILQNIKTLTLWFSMAVVFIAILNVSSVEAKSLKNGEEFKANDGGVITVVSSDEVEILVHRDRMSGGDSIFLGKYTVNGERVRIVTSFLGSTVVEYYKITPDGLVEEKGGRVFYSKAGLAKAGTGTSQTGAAVKPGKTFRDCPSCPEMVEIMAGSFDMRDTNPAHRVTLKSFVLGKTEVTQGQWKAVMGNNPSHFKNCGDTCPVEQVSWNDAKEFIQKLNAKTGKQYRLPTEAEWEYACYGGSQTEYCGGNGLDAVGWYDGNSGSTTHPAGQKQANGYGLYDMTGNVWEWTSDCDKSDCAVPFLRGGSWRDGAQETYRAASVSAGRLSFNGFRVARTLP